VRSEDLAKRLLQIDGVDVIGVLRVWTLVRDSYVSSLLAITHCV
jgi:hypothetical protein